MKNLLKLQLLVTLIFISISVIAQVEYGDGSKRLKAQRGNIWDSNTSAWVPSDSATFGYNQQNLRTQRADLIYNTSSSAWDYQFFAYKTYDANGNVTLEVDSHLNPALYSYREKKSYIYNANNKLTSFTSSSWNSNDNNWRFGYRTQYTYTAGGNASVWLWEVYDTATASWISDNRYLYSYNDVNQNQLDTSLYEVWFNNAWNNYRRTIYTYDGNGNNTQYISEQYNSGTMTWTNQSKTEYTYDAAGNMLTQTSSSWDSGTNSWVYNSRDTYTFNAANQRTSYLIENWNTGSSAWVNQYYYTYTFNANNWQTNSERQDWNANLLAWDNSTRSAYTYDNNGYQTYRFSESWNTTTLAWGNDYEYYYYYEPSVASGIQSSSSAENMFVVFPNPAKDFITLKGNLQEPTPVHIAIIDLNGRMVGNLGSEVMHGSGQKQLNISHLGLNKGMYFVSLQTQNGVKNIPLMIE